MNINACRHLCACEFWVRNRQNSLLTLVVRLQDAPGRVVRMRLSDVTLVIVAAMWIWGIPTFEFRLFYFASSHNVSL